MVSVRSGMWYLNQAGLKLGDLPASDPSSRIKDVYPHDQLYLGFLLLLFCFVFDTGFLCVTLLADLEFAL